MNLRLRLLSEVLLRLLLRLSQGLLLSVPLIYSVLDLVKQAGRSGSLLAPPEGGCLLLLRSKLLLGELLLRPLGSKLLAVELLLWSLVGKLLRIELLLLLIIQPLLLLGVESLLLLLRVELLLLLLLALLLLLLLLFELLLLLQLLLLLELLLLLQLLLLRVEPLFLLLRQAVARLLLHLPPATHRPDINVTREARHTLPGPTVSNHLWYSPVTDLVLVKNTLRSPVPSPSLGSWAPVTSVF